MIRDPSLLEPSFLSRLERLIRLGRRTPRPGPRRRLRARGRGIEPASIRDYAPGDDVRLLDWPAFARLDRLLVRVVEDVPESRLDLVLDVSASMGAASPRPLARATRAAAAIAALALGRGARVVAWSAGEPRAVASPAVRGPGRIVTLLRYLASLEPSGGPALARAADRLAQVVRTRGGAVLLSDLVSAQDAGEAAARLARAGFDTAVVEIGARAELSDGDAGLAASAGQAVLVDAETGSERTIAFGATSLPLALASRADRAAEVARRLAGRAATHERLSWDGEIESAALALLGGRLRR